MLNIISSEGLIAQRFKQRIAALEAMSTPKDRHEAAAREAQLSELYQGKIARLAFPEGFRFEDHVRMGREVAEKEPGAIAEFISTNDFGVDFITRQRYEVDAGRDLEPLLFPSIYNVVEDANLPKHVSINVLGPAGVTFEEVTEGGEVKFASVGSRTQAVEIRHYGVGLKYSEDIFMYNELWRLPGIERQFGQAYNAKMNAVHFAPILAYSYTGNNVTDGTSLTDFRATDRLEDKYARTLDSAVATAGEDSSNPRPGPYILLCNRANESALIRALSNVPQQGLDIGATSRERITSIIAYNGWSGSRGEETATYTGVASGTAYLIDTRYRDMDFQSYFKHGLRQRMGQENVTRFIKAETVWDVRLGVFADPVRAVHKITLPTAASGVS